MAKPTTHKLIMVERNMNEVIIFKIKVIKITMEKLTMVKFKLTKSE